MEINVLIADEFKGRMTKRRLAAVAGQVLIAEKAGNNIEIGILITGQESIHDLNKVYRGKDRPTDVLSFYMNPEEPQEPADIFVTPPDNIRHIGEVIVSYPQALIQARENKHSVQKEVTILLVHGILHLLGYDHEKSISEEKRMREREVKILKILT